MNPQFLLFEQPIDDYILYFPITGISGIILIHLITQKNGGVVKMVELDSRSSGVAGVILIYSWTTFSSH